MSRRFSPILQKKIANSTTSRLQNITSEPRGEFSISASSTWKIFLNDARNPIRVRFAFVGGLSFCEV
jgi:hypothetical protein